MLRTLAGSGVATVVAILLMAVPAGARVDYSGQAYDILAPGEFGGLPANQFSTDQGVLYNDLTPLQGHVTAGDLKKYYLSEKFGVQGPVMRSEQTGRPYPQIGIPEPHHSVTHHQNDPAKMAKCATIQRYHIQ